MFINIFYFFLAVLALSLLVFIHELGHYLAGRKVGMRIEVFSIGFGKPFYTWMRNGVKWQVCYLLFGGFVKFGGMEKEKGLEPHEIKDGFFGKSPRERIFVAVMGPLVNIVFAFLIFSAIWVFGGRAKSFSEFTNIIGSMDPKSELYAAGVRPGDQITKIGDKPYEGFRDLLYAGVLKKPSFAVEGNKVDYFSYEKDPFTQTIKPYATNSAAGFNSLGVQTPASYLIYDKLSGGAPNPLPAGSGLEKSGLEYGDRIVWVQGELVFSIAQLLSIINDNSTLLTVQRGTQTFLSKVPRIHVKDLRISGDERNEFADWHYAKSLAGPFADRVYIPFELSDSMTVQREIAYLDEQSRERFFSEKILGDLEMPLKPGDTILAVDGIRVSSPIDLFGQMQERHVMIITEKMASTPIRSWKGENERFIHSGNWPELSKVIDQIGLTDQVQPVGDFRLLRPVTPVMHKSLFPGSGEELLILGAAFKDGLVSYNPSPIHLFGNILEDMARTLKSLVTGSLNPKWMSGPVGIMHVIAQSYSLGIKEALFWLGMISLNLGVLNLLPIPVLDGGHICFSLYELITRRHIKAKTMERMIIPFVLLLVSFFVYVTFHDLVRFFQ